MKLQKELQKKLNECRFGEDTKDYYSSKKYYLADKRKFDKWKREAKELLKNEFDDDLLKEAARNSRLSWTGKKWEYTPGQFYDLELPGAILDLLETAARIKKLKMRDKKVQVAVKYLKRVYDQADRDGIKTWPVMAVIRGSIDICVIDCEIDEKLGRRFYKQFGDIDALVLMDGDMEVWTGKEKPKKLGPFLRGYFFEKLDN